MRKRNLTSLGETEMEVLQHVWELGEAKVGEVHERILKVRPVAYTTIMTVMGNLTKKGYLTYKKDGVAYVYTTARKPEEVRGSLLHRLTQSVFRGSPIELDQTLVRQEQLSEEDIAELRRLIDSIEESDD